MKLIGLISILLALMLPLYYHSGGDIIEGDRVREVCFSTSFENYDCLTDVYDKVRMTPEGQQLLRPFELDSIGPPLCFRGSRLPKSNQRGTRTGLTSSNSHIIQIYINTDELDRPPLLVARTFFHEMVHAELFRLRAKEKREKLVSEQKNSQLSEYAEKFALNWQHELMAAKYVDIIAKGLASFDNQAESMQVYEALAWVGLRSFTDKNNPETAEKGPQQTSPEAWKALTDEERERIGQTIKDYKKKYDKSCG